MGVWPDRGTGEDRKCGCSPRPGNWERPEVWMFARTGEPGKTGSGCSPGPGNIVVYCEKPIVMSTRLVVGVRPDRGI